MNDNLGYNKLSVSVFEEIVITMMVNVGSCNGNIIIYDQHVV